MSRADRWIGYPAATDALKRLETLLAWPAKQRMPNLLLVGPTNNGKSTIIEKFRRDHPAISYADREEIPVLALQMPSNPSVTRFYTTILAALGAPLRSTYRIAELEQVVLQLLRGAGVRMLVIDELHNVFGGSGDRRREFLNLLRFLGNELRIPLVGVGTHGAYLAIRADDQLENRFGESSRCAAGLEIAVELGEGPAAAALGFGTFVGSVVGGRDVAVDASQACRRVGRFEQVVVVRQCGGFLSQAWARIGAFSNGSGDGRRDGEVAGDRGPVQLVDLLALPCKLVMDALVQLEEFATQFASLGLLRCRFPGRLGTGGKVTAPLVDAAQVLPEGGHDVSELLQLLVDFGRPDRRC
jgi:hypothetical protein